MWGCRTMKRLFLSALLFFALVVFLGACAILRGDFLLPAIHPEDLGKERPICTDCHEPKGEKIVYSRFNHTPLYADSHRQQAYKSERVCFMCHETAFCNDCHATRVELKPSLKDQTSTYRRLPHRGDYLSRHTIDGRIDPTSCYRCHGNPKTSATCVPCHA